MKRTDLLRHPRIYGCYLKREGGSHSIWMNPATGGLQAIPRQVEISDVLARTICRGLGVPELGSRCVSLEEIMTYKVVVTHTDEGYSVGCPELPGCWSEGETEEEALSNIRVAIQEYVSVQPTADAQSKVTFVDVTDVAIPLNGKNGAAERKPFDFGTLKLNLPAEWTSHKVEDLLDILEGPDRR